MENQNDIDRYDDFIKSFSPEEIVENKENETKQKKEKIYYEKILALIPECIDYKKYESGFFTQEKVESVIKGFAESLAYKVDYKRLSEQYELQQAQNETNEVSIDYKAIINLLPSCINFKESILSQKNTQKKEYLKFNLEDLLDSLLESIDIKKLKKEYESDLAIPLERILSKISKNIDLDQLIDELKQKPKLKKQKIINKFNTVLAISIGLAVGMFYKEGTKIIADNYNVVFAFLGVGLCFIFFVLLFKKEIVKSITSVYKSRWTPTVNPFLRAYDDLVYKKDSALATRNTLIGAINMVSFFLNREIKFIAISSLLALIGLLFANFQISIIEQQNKIILTQTWNDKVDTFNQSLQDNYNKIKIDSLNVRTNSLIKERMKIFSRIKIAYNEYRDNVNYKDLDTWFHFQSDFSNKEFNGCSFHYEKNEENEKMKFENWKTKGINFTSSKFHNFNGNKFEFDDCDFTNSKFYQDSSFLYSNNLSKTTFSNSTLTATDFSYCNMIEAEFIDINMNNEEPVVFNKTILIRANFGDNEQLELSAKNGGAIRNIYDLNIEIAKLEEKKIEYESEMIEMYGAESNDLVNSGINKTLIALDAIRKKEIERINNIRKKEEEEEKKRKRSFWQKF